MSQGPDDVVHFVPASLQVYDDLRCHKDICAFFTAKPVRETWGIGVQLKSGLLTAYADSDLYITSPDPVVAMQSFQTVSIFDGVDDIVVQIFVRERTFHALFSSEQLRGIVEQPFRAPRGNQPRPHLRLVSRKAG